MFPWLIWWKKEPTVLSLDPTVESAALKIVWRCLKPLYREKHWKNPVK